MSFCKLFKSSILASLLTSVTAARIAHGSVAIEQEHQQRQVDDATSLVQCDQDNDLALAQALQQSFDLARQQREQQQKEAAELQQALQESHHEQQQQQKQAAELRNAHEQSLQKQPEKNEQSPPRTQQSQLRHDLNELREDLNTLHVKASSYVLDPEWEQRQAAEFGRTGTLYTNWKWSYISFGDVHIIHLGMLLDLSNYHLKIKKIKIIYIWSE